MSINNINKFINKNPYIDMLMEHNKIDDSLYEKYNVQRSLRDINGVGVNAGITNISLSTSTTTDSAGNCVQADGKLYYRGYNVTDLLQSVFGANRYGFEECAYLLLFGELPNETELATFSQMLLKSCELPTHFTQDVIMKAPTADIVANMTKSTLALASYDKKAHDLSIENVLKQCIHLISVFPMIAAYSYQGYLHYEKGKSCYIHKPLPELSVSENILSMLRPNRKYTQMEARVLDLALILHMEHGGGSNSTFTTRVVTSSGSDTYSTIAASLCALKGHLNGSGAYQVMGMMKDLHAHVSDVTDKEAVGEYIRQIVKGEAYNKTGVVYGVGHPFYSISDPRALEFKKYVKELAHEKSMQDEFALYELVEEIAPKIIAEERKMYKGVCINIDFYSGLLYKMLKLPKEMFTPLFAIARVVGWSAHRLEELTNSYKIIRPAYTSICEPRDYTPLEDR